MAGLHEGVFLTSELGIGIDHHADELLEADSGGPAEASAGLGSVATEVVDLGGSKVSWIDFDVVVPVEVGVSEGDIEEIADAVGLAGRDYEIIGSVLLKHQPHGLDVVAGESPIADGIEV